MGKGTLVLALVLALVIGYGAGQLVPYSNLAHDFSGASTTTTSANGCASGPQAVALAILTQYEQNAANADSAYNGKTLCVEGAVYSVQQVNGGYESCVNTKSSTPEGDCGSVTNGGWIVYEWASQATAQRVYATTSNPPAFVALYSVSLQNQNLILGNCIVELSPYSP